MGIHYAPRRLGGSLLLGVLLALAVWGLSNRAAAADAPTPTSSGEILSVLQTLNDGEIQQAKLALSTSNNPQVRETAKLIIDDHTASNERIAALSHAIGSPPMESALSRGLRAQAQQVLDELARLSRPSFDRVYLEKQAELHQAALDTLQTRLLPGADDPQVRQLLTSTEPRLRLHQETAVQAHASLSQVHRG